MPPRLRDCRMRVAVESMKDGESKSDAKATMELDAANAEAAEAAADVAAVSVEAEMVEYELQVAQNRPMPKDGKDQHELQAHEKHGKKEE